MTLAGHVLKPGETLEHNGLVFKVERVERRRVMRVHLKLPRAAEEPESASTPESVRAAG